IARWNLFKLGETLQGLIPEPALQEELNAFAKIFSGYYLKKMAGKLGLEVVDERFEETLNQLLQILATHQPDYTNFFRRLARRRTGGAGELRQGFAAAPESLDAWLTRHEELLDREDVGPEEQQRRMEAANPKFILRNYLAQHAIEKALKEQSFTEINRLFHLLRSPYRDQPELFERLGIDPEVYTVDTPESYASLRVSCSA
ncbi:MAG: protein adenylyltransferase SelO family protein, partial [Nitrospinaceae bacterium]